MYAELVVSPQREQPLAWGASSCGDKLFAKIIPAAITVKFGKGSFASEPEYRYVYTETSENPGRRI